jgi:predicted nicotinamide N-methyase
MTTIHDVAGLRLEAPSDPERLPGGYERPPGERRLPYWARLWPSSGVLIKMIEGELADRLRGRSVVELGCGLAAAGLVAARAGAQVTLTDREPQALVVAQDNARRNQLEVRVAQLTWDRVPEAMVGRFDVVLATDLAYDRAEVPPLMGAIHALLAPGGEAWLVDPCRLGVPELLAAAAAADLEARWIRSESNPEPQSDGGDDMHVVHLTLR